MEKNESSKDTYKKLLEKMIEDKMIEDKIEKIIKDKIEELVKKKISIKINIDDDKNRNYS